MPELERHILLVYRQGLLVGYILHEIIGRSCPLAVAMMEEAVLAQLHEYVRTHVVPAL